MSRNLRHSEKDNFLSDEQFQFMYELEHGPSSSGLNGTTSANPVLNPLQGLNQNLLSGGNIVASGTPSLNPPWNPCANQGLNQNPSLNLPWNPYANQGLNQNPSLNPPWNPYANQGLNQNLPSGRNIAASVTPGLNPPQNANALYTLATVKEILRRDQIENGIGRGYGGSLPGISQSSSGTLLQPQSQPPVNVQQNVQLNRLNPLGTTDPRYQQPRRSFDDSFLEKYIQFQISQAVSTLEFFWGVRLQYEPPQSEPSTFGPSHSSGNTFHNPHNFPTSPQLGPSHASGSAQTAAQFAGTTTSFPNPNSHPSISAQSASQPIGSTFSANLPYYSPMGPKSGTPNSNAGTS